MQPRSWCTEWGEEVSSSLQRAGGLFYHHRYLIPSIIRTLTYSKCGLNVSMALTEFLLISVSQKTPG